MDSQSFLRTSSGICFASEIIDREFAPRAKVVVDAQRFDPMGRLQVVRAEIAARKSNISPPPPARKERLISLAEARNSNEIRYRGLDITNPAPTLAHDNGVPVIDIGVPVANFRNFKLISREDAQKIDSIRYHSIMF